MEQWVQTIRDFAFQYGPVVLQSLAVLIGGWIVARIIRGILRRIMNRAQVEPTLVGFIVNLAHSLLMALVIITAIQQLGVPTASFIAVIGAAGLAVGFALQGSLSNFAAGVMLIIFRPFKAGDYVEAGGTSGTIEKIEIFATTLKTPDNKRVIVPNASITNGTIVNYSANETRRLDLVFGIGYEDDIKRAKEIIIEILSSDNRVLKDPTPVVAVLELADSSVNIAVRPWVTSSDYWGVYFDLLETVKLRFDAANISIPFPQRDVHIHETRDTAA